MSRCRPFHCLFVPRHVCVWGLVLWALTLTAPLPARSGSDTPAGEQGLLGSSHAGLKLRSYTDYLNMNGQPERNASVLGARPWISSEWTPGPIGFAASASLFSALTLAADRHAGNMAHAGSPDSWRQRGWAYIGQWDVQARAKGSLLRYGLLLPEADAHYLVPHDNRALPPTFRGGSFVSEDIPGLELTAGSVDRVVPRGQDRLQRLATEYARAPVSRFSYVGGTYQAGKGTQLTVSANQARDVWNRFYVSAQHDIGKLEDLQWMARVDYYHTTDTGQARGGGIRNDAYSIALTARHRAHAVTLAFQQILSDQFFDYLGETADSRLANSMDVDYNAPHERSIQLRYAVNLGDHGAPGLNITVWAVKGWGADASHVASRVAPGTLAHDLYWSDGEPVHGPHYELGVIPAYTIQSSRLKGSTVALSVMRHIGSAHYSDATSDSVRLMINVPAEFF